MIARLTMSMVCLVASSRCLSTSRFGSSITVLVLFGGRSFGASMYEMCCSGVAVVGGGGRGVTEVDVVWNP